MSGAGRRPLTPHQARFARGMTNQRRAEASYHPYGTAETPMVMPITRVLIGTQGAAVEDMVPLIAPNGAIIPATAPHTWFNVYAAGRA